MIVSTTMATTPATVTKCADCFAAGTSYCSLNNNQFSCTCKQGELLHLICSINKLPFGKSFCPWNPWNPDIFLIFCFEAVQVLITTSSFLHGQVTLERYATSWERLWNRQHQQLRQRTALTAPLLALRAVLSMEPMESGASAESVSHKGDKENAYQEISCFLEGVAGR